MLKLQSCTIYSLGLNNDPSFDEDFQKFLNNKCQLRSFDKDDQNQGTIDRLKKANGTFMKAFIANSTDAWKNQYTFKETVKILKDRRIDILKIDIEGNEFQIADEIISIPICQLLIEIHNDSPKKTLDLLKKFASSGLYLFSYEINGQEHHLSEYSFIHESCFADYGVKIIYGRYLV
uniref:Methyltransferase domain-containing protein n=1 Tax=Panagrolaimus superbus TaxID=310955 RepID=A0A914Y6L3_9BILA